MCNWTWIKSYEPNGPFSVFERKGCLYKVMGVRWVLGEQGCAEALGLSPKLWAQSRLNRCGRQLGGGGGVGPFNTPKLTLRTLSFLALRKGFSLLLGSREWDCVK